MRRPDILFGVATADHQCEAFEAPWTDVRDRFDERMQLTTRGSATDFWHRYKEDAELAASLGCRAFRFSIAWARVEPEPDRWDELVLSHYAELAETVRRLGMEPVVTLHHYTWPLHIESGGGLTAPGFPIHFAAYADAVARHLGNQVTYWITINEPTELVFGYIKPWWQGEFRLPPGDAPGLPISQQIDRVLKLIPNLFTAHKLARDAIKRSNQNALVSANPLIIGLPYPMRRYMDRQTTRLRQPDQLARKLGRIAVQPLARAPKADVVIGVQRTARHGLRADFSLPLDHGRGGMRRAVAVPKHRPDLMAAVNRVITSADHDPSPPLSGIPTVESDWLTVGVVGPAGTASADAVSEADRQVGARLAAAIVGDPKKTRFISVNASNPVSGLSSPFGFVDRLLRWFGLLTMILNSNWWHLGMAGQLPDWLCPRQCQFAQDFAALDYYWGVPWYRFWRLGKLAAAAAGEFESAPVWPGGLRSSLGYVKRKFPSLPVFIIENGSVDTADGISRSDYLRVHIEQMKRAIQDGVHVIGHLCWSITSNREWGLAYGPGNDFGLFHIDLDADSGLVRVRTPAADTYASLINSAGGSP